MVFLDMTLSSSFPTAPSLMDHPKTLNNLQKPAALEMTQRLENSEPDSITSLWLVAWKCLTEWQ